MKTSYEIIKKNLIIFVILMATGLTSPARAQAPSLRILCSTFPVYQITRNIIQGRESSSAALMLPAHLGCPHDYVLTPKDMHLLAAADIFIINGLGLEQFLGLPLRQANPEITVIDSSQGASVILASEDKKSSHDDHDHGHNAPNPHLFASPRQAAKIAISIARELSRIDPDGKEIYLRNSETYAEKMNALAQEFTTLASTLSSKKIITQHSVFDYLARDMGLDVVAVIESDPGQEPSASEMIALIKTAKASQAKAIFAEPQYPSRVIQTIAKEIGIASATLDPVATGPDDADLDYYEKVMRDNMDTLSSTLGAR